MLLLTFLLCRLFLTRKTRSLNSIILDLKSFEGRFLTLTTMEEMDEGLLFYSSPDSLELLCLVDYGIPSRVLPFYKWYTKLLIIRIPS